MKERIIRFNWGTKKENLNFFATDRERKMAKTGASARHIHVYLSIGSTPPPPGNIRKYCPFLRARGTRGARGARGAR